MKSHDDKLGEKKNNISSWNWVLDNIYDSHALQAFMKIKFFSTFAIYVIQHIHH